MKFIMFEGSLINVDQINYVNNASLGSKKWIDIVFANGTVQTKPGTKEQFQKVIEEKLKESND